MPKLAMMKLDVRCMKMFELSTKAAEPQAINNNIHNQNNNTNNENCTNKP